METAYISYQYKPYEYMKEEYFEKAQDTGPKTFEELQAKVIELELELKKQKEAAEKDAKVLNLIWGDQFETDSLH